MARQFVMGARMTLSDMFTRPLKSMERATDAFSASVERADKAVKGFRDAQGRLRDESGRFVSEGRRMSNFLNGLRNPLRAAQMNTDSLASSFVALGLEIAALIAAKKLFDATFGAAAHREMQELTIQAMFLGDTKGAQEYMNMISGLAIDSPLFAEKDYYSNSKSFVAMSKNINQLKQMWQIAERFAAMDPVQGLDGAVFAMREMFSGDSVSMVERFEMPRKIMNEIKKMDIQEQLDAMDELLTQMGFSSKFMEDVSGAALAHVNQIKEKFARAWREMGEAGLMAAKPYLISFNRYLDTGALNNFTEAGRRGFQNMVESIGAVLTTIIRLGSHGVDFIREKLYTWREEWRAFAGLHQTELEKIEGVFVKVWNTIEQKAKPVLGWLRDDALPKIDQALLGIADKTLEVAEYFIDNWDDIAPFIYGVAIAWGTYKTALIAVELWTKAVIAAQLLWNWAITANPIGLIVVGIGLLVGGLIWLYKNQDIARQKAYELWTALENNPLAAIALGPMGLLLVAGKKLYDNWDSIRTKAISTWIDIENAFISGTNRAITAWNSMMNLVGADSKVVSLIEMKTKPGTPPPVMEMPQQGPATNPFSSYQRGTSPSNPFIDGSHATGLWRVPFDGYVGELHKDEMILPATEAQAYREEVNPAGNVGQASSGAAQVTIDKLFGQLVIQGTEAPSVEAMVDELMALLYERLKDADDIVSTAGMGALL